MAGTSGGRKGRRIDFESTLNPEQLAAVTHGAGPQLVLAGAGSGKTRVITYRIAWLVQERGVDPAQITAVTFTNKAAAEMRERTEELLGIYPLPASVGTFHRFALRLLRIYGTKVGLRRDFAIFDSDDQKRILKRALDTEGLDTRSFRPQAVLAAISGAKNRLLTPDHYEAEADDFFRRRVARVYRRYQRLLRKAGGVDFDDMISLAVRLLRESDVGDRIRRRTRHLLVDEFQDTNHAQLSLVLELVGSGGNLTAVGDEDQGIYRWRGAELDNILRFEDSFPGAEVRKLERNYRSTQNILDASGAVVSNNQGRRGKRLWTEAGPGEPVRLYRAPDERDEARWVVDMLRRLESEHPLEQMAILVRTNAQTRSFEDELLRRGMDYNLLGGVRFYERAEIKDLVAYLRLVRNPEDDHSMERIINRPPRGIGKTSQDRLREKAEAAGTSRWRVLQEDSLEDFGTRGKKALERFRTLLESLVSEAERLPLRSLLEQILETTSYADLYDRKDEDGRMRLENIDELLSATREYAIGQGYGEGDAGDDTLTGFLDHVALTSDTDGLGLRRGPSLMTLHSAKGLEFEVVVVAGLEEKILPHANAQHSPEDLEEERRLLYVGMTRARQRLLLTTCLRRQVAGTYQDQEESRFLEEIPGRCLTSEESPQLAGRAGSGFSTGGRMRQDIYRFFGKSSSAPAVEDEAQEFPPDLPAYEPDAPKSGGRLRKGSRVRHPSLGEGQVFRIEGTGDQMRLTVYFQGTGRRTLVAKYAKLEVL